MILSLGVQPAWADGVHCSPSGNVLFYGDWECGTTSQDFSPWSNIKKPNDPKVAFTRNSTSPRSGNSSATFNLEQGWVTTNAGSRSEVGLIPSTYAAFEGDDHYYSLSVKFDEKWPYCSNGFCIFAQWHQYGFSGSPSIFLYTPYTPLAPDQGSTDFQNLGVFRRAGTCPIDPGTCSTEEVIPIMDKTMFETKGRNVWHDFILHVKWSPTDNGIFEIWHRLEGQADFRLVTSETNVETLKRFPNNVPTCVPGNSTFPECLVVKPVEMRTGIYRGSSAYEQPMRLENDSVCATTTYAAAKSCIDG